MIGVANISPSLSFAFCPCLWCFFAFGAFWNHAVLAGWIANILCYNSDFIIKSTNAYKVSAEQYKKGRGRFSPLGIKGWINQIKQDTFILNLNNCYYLHCARAVISGSQRKNKQNRTVTVTTFNAWNLIISRPYLGLGSLETTYRYDLRSLFLLFWMYSFNILCIQTHNFYEKGIPFRADQLQFLNMKLI